MGESENNPAFMLDSCRLSCGVCSGPPTPVPTPAPSQAPTPSCTDDDASCEAWAAMGECENNPAFMLASCRLSCGVCSGPPTPVPTPATTQAPTPSCTDDNASCEAWAAMGECENNPVFMLDSCRLSCGVCS